MSNPEPRAPLSIPEVVELLNQTLADHGIDKIALPAEEAERLFVPRKERAA